MMKKTYITPSTICISIQSARLLSGSTEQLGVGSSDYDGKTTVESRRFGGIWDDEYDE